MHESSTTFTPTPASIPALDHNLTLSTPPNLPSISIPLCCKLRVFSVKNPLEFLLRAAQIYPEKLALVHPDVQFPACYTHSTWAQRVQNFAYGLLQAGTQLGDRIAVLAPNWCSAYGKRQSLSIL
ncbi:hypothetical protein EI94DRAFT_1716946 [Lactarius quietus]|nr:hypothetical protein EI94DRAFT_1716946 [Lactarius quietus]